MYHDFLHINDLCLDVRLFGSENDELLETYTKMAITKCGPRALAVFINQWIARDIYQNGHNNHAGDVF